VVLSLTRTYRLSVYDAAYLELAQRKALPLATLDHTLISAAQATSIPLIGKQ
jgi:predicted nucleic acid-binding protein